MNQFRLAPTRPAVTPAMTQRTKLNVLFLILLFFGLHTTLTFGFLPHYFFAFMSAVGLLALNSSAIKARAVLWVATTTVVMCIIGILARFTTDGNYVDAIRATINFVYDIIIGMSLYFSLLRIPPRVIRLTFLTLLIVLIAGSFLEVVGVTKSASDSFRAAVLRSGLYQNNERDVSNYGALRPKFFASEPSYLGVSIAMSFFAWFCSLNPPRRKHYLLAFLLLSAGLYLVRTPVIVFGAIAYFLTVCVTRKRDKSWKGTVYRTAVPVYIVATLVAPTVFFALLAASWAPGYMKTGSFMARQIAPFYMAVKSSATRPFGVGLTNDDAISKLGISTYNETGLLSTVQVGGWEDIGRDAANAFWFSFISLGVAGVIILVMLLRWLFRILKVPISLFSVCAVVCFTFWLTFGRINTPAWVTFFLVTAMCELRVREGHVPEPPASPAVGERQPRGTRQDRAGSLNWQRAQR